MKEKIINGVKDALLKTLPLDSVEDIHLDARLKEDLGLDSMSSLTFLMALEDSFQGFVVNPETLNVEDLVRLSTIVDYISKEMHFNAATQNEIIS